jgi:hypothetical protein
MTSILEPENAYKTKNNLDSLKNDIAEYKLQKRDKDAQYSE